MDLWKLLGEYLFITYCIPHQPIIRYFIGRLDGNECANYKHSSALNNHENVNCAVSVWRGTELDLN